MKNYFYVFEGIDGSGKTTLINELKTKLSKNYFYFTKEPCETILGNTIKEIVQKLVKKNDHISQYLFFAAARSYHIKNIIQPKLQNNSHVISDRFVYSSLVYQGMDVNEDFIKLVYENSNYGITVDKIFFCKISYQIALQRIEKRNMNDMLDNYYKNKLEILANRYESLFENNKSVVVLDMTLPIERILERVLEELQ